MGILTWIILGLVAGAIANAVDPNPSKGGVFGAIVLGIVGAFVGGFLGNLIFGLDVSGINFTSLALAVGGALVLLFVGRMLGRSSTY